MERILPEWIRVLDSPELPDILRIVRSEPILAPKYEDIFKFAELCPWPPRVVICGQDPYTNGTATGLAFSVPPDTKIPPSLKNIAAAIGFSPAHGDLTLLARRGVALINSALTTTNVAKAHSKIWKGYIREVLTRLAAICPIMAFGDDAAKLCAGLSPLVWGHPSPLNRNNSDDNPLHFRHCPHFAAIPIDWDWCGKPAVIYTDGGAVKNGKVDCKAAYAWIIQAEGVSMRFADKLPPPCTNNRAELYAILTAIRAAKPHATWAILYTDSTYAINCITRWYATWIKKGETKCSMDLIGEIIDEKFPVVYRHVRSHQPAPEVITQEAPNFPTNRSIHQGNKECDEMCSAINR